MSARAALRAAILAACVALPATAHQATFTPGQIAWMNRQRALDGTKCCDETDVRVGMSVEWRISGGRYELNIGGVWVGVPPGRVMRFNPGDPSPWPGEALAFYSLFSGGHVLWCFWPEALH